MNYKLGQKVTFDKKLIRIADDRQVPGTIIFDCWKVWNESPHPLTEGIVIGKRTLWDGIAFYDEGFHFEPKSHRDALIIAYSLSRKPVLVPIDNVKIADS